APCELAQPRPPDGAVVSAALEAYDIEHARARTTFYTEVARGRPGPPAEIGRRIEFRYRGHPYDLHVYQLGPTTYRVTTATSPADLHVVRLGGRRARCR